MALPNTSNKLIFMNELRNIRRGDPGVHGRNPIPAAVEAPNTWPIRVDVIIV
jgi:hypothetical protein